MNCQLPLVLLVVACTKEHPSDPPAGDDDDSPVPSECEEDGECGRQEICEENLCIAGDRDNTFEEATPLPLGEDLAVSGVVYPAGDRDTYVYESDSAEWVSIRTVVEDGSELDTVVTLYDADGEIQAVMDDYPVWPFLVDGYDAVLYAYLPEAGSWYVTVEDQTSYYEELEPDGRRDWSYDVLVREAVASGEPDTAANPSIAIDVVNGDTISVVGIVIDEPGDSDFASITFPSDQLLEVWGEFGVTGSSADPLIRLSEGTDVVAEKSGIADGQWLSWFHAHPGTFLLEATDASGGGGADAWFPIFVRTYNAGDNHPFFGANTYEREIEPNDDPATALVLTRTEESNDEGPYGAYRLDGELGSSTDSDWYSVSGDEGSAVSVRCWTDRFGSKALLDVELYSLGAKFAEGTVGDDSDYYVIDAFLPAAGPFEARIVANSDGGPADWYRCAVYVAP